MKKLDNSVIIKLFNDKGYNIIGDIKNTTTPIKCEKQGYWYKISYHNLEYDKKPSLWGFYNIENLEHNINNFIKKREIKAKFLSYSIVIHKQKKRILLTFQCECGQIFNKILEDAIYKTYLCCNNCALKKRGINRRKSDKNIAIIKMAGYKIINCPQNLRNNELVEVEDDKGFRGFISTSKIQCGKNISKFDERINKKYYIYNVNNLIKINGNDCICLDFIKKQHTRTSLLFRCNCGNEFITSIASFQNGKVRCEKCAKSISKYEYEFKTYLDSLKISYIYQYSLNQCKDILPLPFDFFIEKYKCLIEIDGEGHYHICHFNQISTEKATKSFESTQKHDKIKNDFCKNNNIPLLRIPYTAFIDKNYQQLFQNFIREVTNSNK